MIEIKTKHLNVHIELNKILLDQPNTSTSSVQYSHFDLLINKVILPGNL